MPLLAHFRDTGVRRGMGQTSASPPRARARARAPARVRTPKRRHGDAEKRRAYRREVASQTEFNEIRGCSLEIRTLSAQTVALQSSSKQVPCTPWFGAPKRSSGEASPNLIEFRTKREAEEWKSIPVWRAGAEKRVSGELYQREPFSEPLKLRTRLSEFWVSQTPQL